MILYCDTSALVKRYVQEESSNQVQEQWEQALEIATSVVAFAEAAAAFRRKFHEGGIPQSIYEQIIKQFSNEYTSLILIPISGELNKMIIQLLSRHPLRGFDAIHLASAMLMQQAGSLNVKFACFDQQLNSVAELEGLDVLGRRP